ncbi:MAG: NUDIX domain-containing protein [Anaerolineaceae bacterium]|jgi:isopentenyldiphosphate isomerase|nr:NUDIX domain-containing protein [Anaerolineaceae bacterium]MDD4042838.1 NUDIX domain-containing protein [Anaerolineaceae bacterium]MDD4578678.1 NUDIX domain-containing protein [Anaerolineaceae bacterium]
MEVFDLYDLNRIRTGETIERGQKPPAGRYHLVIHVCIFNQEDQMLIQKRSENKTGWAGLWDVSVGGAAQKGDSSQQAAHRELMEELSLDYDFSLVRPAVTVNFPNGFDDIYLIQLDLEPSRLRLQDNEVEEVKWASQEEIKAMIQNGEFIPYHLSLIDLLFEYRFHPGLFH